MMKKTMVFGVIFALISFAPLSVYAGGARADGAGARKAGKGSPIQPEALLRSVWKDRDETITFIGPALCAIQIKYSGRDHLVQEFYSYSVAGDTVTFLQGNHLMNGRVTGERMEFDDFIHASSNHPIHQNFTRQPTPPVVDAALARDYLSKAFAAEREGKIPAALFWYYNAEYYDPNLTEAKIKLGILSESLHSGDPWGNITGNNAQIEIEKRKRWEALRNERDTFFMENPQRFSLQDIRFSDAGLKRGDVDFKTETIPYTLSVHVALLNHSAANTFNDIDGFKALYTKIGDAEYELWKYMYTLRVELVNGNGVTIAVSPEPPKTLEAYQYNSGRYYIGGARRTWIPASNAKIIPYLGFALTTITTNRSGELGYYVECIAGGEELGLGGNIYMGGPMEFKFVVSANDVTDTNMSVRINRIYEYGLVKPKDDDDHKVLSLLRTIDIGGGR
jgi:hypothetical protein